MSGQLSFDLSGTAPETQPLQLTLDKTAVKPGKVCPVCNRYKPYSDFSREKTTKDKYSWECRECNRSSPTTKRLNKEKEMKPFTQQAILNRLSDYPNMAVNVTLPREIVIEALEAWRDAEAAIKEAIAAEREACARVAEKNLETAEAILGGSNQFLRLQAAQTAYLCKIIAKEIRARSEGGEG